MGENVHEYESLCESGDELTDDNSDDDDDDEVSIETTSFKSTRPKKLYHFANG
jgi:hypothetical protein